MNVKFLPDPDDVGSAEYRAIHELMRDCEDVREGMAVCDEFITWAEAMKENLISYERRRG